MCTIGPGWKRVVGFVSLWMGCAAPLPEGLPDPTTFAPPSVDTAQEDDAQASAEQAEEPDDNHPPRIRRLVILPERPQTDDDLRADVSAVDPDGDPLAIDWEWRINGRTVLEAAGRVLPARLTAKGQAIQVEVTVSDGHSEVRRLSDPVRILDSPPRIERGRYAISLLDGYRVKAVDPDGDRLVFKLENAPPGLTIDRRTGELHFVPPTDIEETRTWDVRIIVEDPDGEQAIWTFGVTLTPGRPPER